jgi:O-acetyl-ADP-ribose deacetylase (regulator of RNase III)
MTHYEPASDEWQLEALCNIAAAELLMPVGSFRPPTRAELSVDRLLEKQSEYEVSTEPLFIRAAQVSSEPCAMFCASRTRSSDDRRYRVEYAIGSRAWGPRIPSGTLLPSSSVVSHCTAIGYTAKGHESWGGSGLLRVECVGVPPYPRSSVPRAIGILLPSKAPEVSGHRISEVKGNALSPRGLGSKLIAHVVNETTPNWGGGGFAQAVRAKWPYVQDDFKSWVEQNRSVLSLGTVRFSNADDDIVVASMVCQKGYGPSPRPRIRYTALRECLEKVAVYVGDRKLSVHMPRIGCGQAGGSWEIVRELVESSLCGSATSVTVYDLPNKKRAEAPQRSLGLTSA